MGGGVPICNRHSIEELELVLGVLSERGKMLSRGMRFVHGAIRQLLSVSDTVRSSGRLE